MKSQALNQKTKRLEARVSAAQKDLFQRAANLTGQTLTDFTVTALLMAAKQTIKEYNIINLSLKDQTAFAEAIFNPPQPNSQLLNATKRYEQTVESK